jgi:hypothetical protein
VNIKVEAVQLESGAFVQRISIDFPDRQRAMLIPVLRDAGQTDRLSAELRALWRG